MMRRTTFGHAIAEEQFLRRNLVMAEGLLYELETQAAIAEASTSAHRTRKRTSPRSSSPSSGSLASSSASSTARQSRRAATASPFLDIGRGDIYPVAVSF